MENVFKDGENKLEFAKVLDKVALARKTGAAFTSFFDPVSCEKYFRALANQSLHGVTLKKSGGYENAERNMIGIFCHAPDDSFPIQAVTVKFNKFNNPPGHRDYLGAILGLGLDRSRVGDIRLGESAAVVYVHSDVASFICENLTRVGRAVVSAKLGEVVFIKDKNHVKRKINVTSMRLDAVLAAGFNTARGKAATLIESEKVFVNWQAGKKTQIINEGDTITVRGMGRLANIIIEGTTRKDKIVLSVEVEGK